MVNIKNIKQYIDPTPTRLNVAFEAVHGEETIEFLWYDMDSQMNSVRDYLWEIANTLESDSRL